MGRLASDRLELTATAPVRVCDLGGWTDTWFGGPGRVMNVAVGPGVRVDIEMSRGRGVTSFLVPQTAGVPPMLTAAAERFPADADTDRVVSVRSDVPPGAATGTSASVLVAVLAGLAATTGRELDPDEVARQAYLVETADLGRESGVQDQIAAAHGGINRLVIESFPDVDREQLPAWEALDHHLTTVYLGLPHDSGEVHRAVIDARPSPTVLDGLRAAAEAGATAVRRQDAGLLAAAMTANTEAQDQLHPTLVSGAARGVWELARRAGATGWKVNGAGGQGGSVTIISPAPDIKAHVEEEIRKRGLNWSVLPLHPAWRGVHLQRRG